MGIFSHDEDASWSDVIYYEEQVKELKAENDRLKEENGRLNRNIIEALKHEKEALDVSIKYKDTLQEIKGVVTALYMNNWLQMNETARKSIQLLQELITKTEEE